MLYAKKFIREEMKDNLLVYYWKYSLLDDFSNEDFDYLIDYFEDYMIEDNFDELYFDVDEMINILEDDIKNLRLNLEDDLEDYDIVKEELNREIEIRNKLERWKGWLIVQKER